MAFCGKITTVTFNSNEMGFTMKKRFYAMLMCVTLVAGLTACGTTADKKTDDAGTEADAKDDNDKIPDDGSLTGFNMISDGDFSDGVSDWDLYTMDGTAALTWKSGVLACKIASVGTVKHGVQIFYDTYKVVEGCEYELQFDACSDVPRTIEYRIQINGSDYHAYSQEEIQLTEEMQHYDIKFIMSETTDPAPRLCFNLGYFEGDTQTGEDHIVYFDNFELYCIDDSGYAGEEDTYVNPNITTNQIGYITDAEKIAVFSCDDQCTDFTVINTEDDSIAYEGSVSDYANNKNTEREEAQADFSELTTPGTYKIVGSNGCESYEFTIGDNVYEDAFSDIIKFYYMQRCGEELTEDLAGDFAHAACHTAEAVYYEDQDGETVDVSGGWHDAGDYGRYVVAGAKAAEDLMLAYEKYTDAFTDDAGTPESGNGIPDVLDEVRYELEWMFKMQDSDGGVHHKVTCAVFPETVMPDEETDTLIITPVSTTATGTFAAVMAKASSVYADIDADFAARCLAASKLAYEYLMNNSIHGGVSNPDGISTGAYNDSSDMDERFWASAELFKVTGDSAYEEKITEYLERECNMDFGWQSVGMYGVYAYLTANPTNEDSKQLSIDELTEYTDKIIARIEKNTYNSSVYLSYNWGSNMTIANNAMALLMCDEILGTDYSVAAQEQLDYICGNNGNGYCFITGYGTLYPTGVHHRPTQVVGYPVSGMLIGGADCNLEDSYAAAVLADAAPELCYADNVQSYSCNEITIYWNSPLVYLMASEISKTK